MANGVFVTGTGTGVGKTVAAAALVCHVRARRPVRYWKPIQTGIEQDDDTGEVTRLAQCVSDEVLNEGVRLRHAVSPHLAAALNHSAIDCRGLLATFSRADDGRYWIVEGAGGVLVPIDEDQLMIDLIVALGLPALIASRTVLGTINHTLLTLEALRHRDVPIAGVIMVGTPDAHNRQAIERHGRVGVIGEMPLFEPLTAEAVAGWAVRGIDPAHHLAR